MKNICLVLEYVGTNYCGFQKQKNGISIQQILENAISLVTKENTKTYPSGRTDAGVHALGQVVNFHTNSKIPPDKFFFLLNNILPKDIRVLKSFEVPNDFHSRKSAKSKTYIYKIYNGKNFSVFDEDRVLFYKKPLDFELLQKGAELIKGTHNFSAFVSSNATTKTTVRTIYRSTFQKKGDYFIYCIKGNGFLYNMVRILVGTLLEVGSKKRSFDNLKSLLNGEDRNKSGKTVSPCGLYLKEVNY